MNSLSLAVFCVVVAVAAAHPSGLIGAGIGAPLGLGLTTGVGAIAPIGIAAAPIGIAAAPIGIAAAPLGVVSGGTAIRSGALLTGGTSIISTGGLIGKGCC